MCRLNEKGVTPKPVKTIRVNIYNTGNEYKAMIEEPINGRNYSVVGFSVDDVIKSVKHYIVNISELNLNNSIIEFVYIIPNMVLKNEKVNTDNHNDSTKVNEIFTLMNQAKMTLTEINTLTDKERSDLVKLFTK